MFHAIRMPESLWRRWGLPVALGALFICSGCGGAADGRTGQPGHLDEFLGDPVEFLVEGLAHVDPSCLGVLADALSQSDVNAQGTTGEHLSSWSKSHA